MRRRDILEKCLAAAVSVCLTAAAVPVGMTAAPVKAAEADMTVVLQPADQSPFHDGTFEGWGTSLCWWASRIGNNEALTDKATKAFFDKEDGLGMTIGRYNVGGGDDPTHNHITRSDTKIPGYLVLDDSGEMSL